MRLDPWEYEDRDVPFYQLDVFNNDHDAFLASVQDLRRGGHGIWYDQNDSGELDRLKVEATELLAAHEEPVHELEEEKSDE